MGQEGSLPAMDEEQGLAQLGPADSGPDSGEDESQEESKAHKRAVKILKLARAHYRRRLRRLSYRRLY